MSINPDLTIIRDFLDVKDVLKAYYLLLKKGKAGETYNICSGIGITLHQIILKMSIILGIDFELEINPQLIRPNENRIVLGSYDKIKNYVGWSPSISIDESLEDIIRYLKIIV